MSERCDFGTFGRYEEIPVERMPPEIRDAFEFTKKLRGFAPGPHKVWLANPKLSKTVVATGANDQTQSTLNKDGNRKCHQRDQWALAGRLLELRARDDR